SLIGSRAGGARRAATFHPDQTFTAPRRRTRGGSTVVSRTVEASPPAVGPPSSTRSTASPKYASTADAVVGGSSPLGLALGAVTGAPRAPTRPRATGCGERRALGRRRVNANDARVARAHAGFVGLFV